MKTITIRLSDVGAAMLVEAQKRNKDFENLRLLLAELIRSEYEKTPGVKARGR